MSLSPIKRVRKTRAETEEFRRAIWDITESRRACSGRQVYYLAVVDELVPKDEGSSRAGEARVQYALNVMRENWVAYGLANHVPGGRIAEYMRHREAAEDAGSTQPDFDAARNLLIMPFGWITDDTRSRYQAAQFTSREAAQEDWFKSYRRDLWRQQPRHVEAWCESESIASMLMEVTDDYGLALLPCRGQASKAFVFQSAQAYTEIGKPVTCLYVGDFDPNGLDIDSSLQERLARYGAPDVEFRRIGITPQQVRDLDLVGHGLNPKIAAPVLRRFLDECNRWFIPHEAVEAEAMDPTDLRALLREAIEEYIDERQWELELEIEKQERRDLQALLIEGSGDA